MLRNVQMPERYFTATSERLLKEVYIPALAESSLYQRGVAFFSIAFFLRMMDGIVEFVGKGGVMHLVTSVELDEDTVQSIASGYLLSEADVQSRLLESIESYKVAAVNAWNEDEAKLDVVANMIASRHLVLKVAYVPSGLYHEKIGLFSDSMGNSISFIGSANATINAYRNNFETINLFTSWDAPELVKEHRTHFARLWNDDIGGINVIPFPEAVEKHFLEKFRKSPSLAESLSRLTELRKRTSPRVSSTEVEELRDYQKAAIGMFVDSGFCSFYEMATGTGKTFTAIKSIERMMETHKILNVVILVPLKDLQRQWANAIKHSFTNPHSVYEFGGSGHSSPIDFNLSAAGRSHGEDKFAAIAVCVYDTFFMHAVNEISPVEGPVLLIVDEAHNLNAGHLSRLQGFTPYRLGLSATPQRFNEEETRSVLKYFLKDGCNSFKFDLKDAIEQGFLSPYEYYPIPVTLTEDELESYQKLTCSIGAMEAISKKKPTQENRRRLDDLKMARSLIVKKAVNKLELLESLVDSPDYDFSNSVVFCGPGSVDKGDNMGTQRLIDLVTLILSNGKSRRYFPAKYTSSEGDRPARLEDFKEGRTDTLVAIKCFDEGLDVPALDKIYIMSSDSSLRQTIQRRGRVLRISKKTGKEKARIYDFVAGEGDGYYFVPLQTECPRVWEYSRLSLNPEASESILRFYTPSDNGVLFDDTTQED